MSFFTENFAIKTIWNEPISETSPTVKMTFVRQRIWSQKYFDISETFCKSKDAICTTENLQSNQFWYFRAIKILQKSKDAFRTTENLQSKLHKRFDISEPPTFCKKAKMPFVRQMEKQFERGKKGQLISKKFAKSKVENKTLKSLPKARLLKKH